MYSVHKPLDQISRHLKCITPGFSLFDIAADQQPLISMAMYTFVLSLYPVANFLPMFVLTRLCRSSVNLIIRSEMLTLQPWKQKSYTGQHFGAQFLPMSLGKFQKRAAYRLFIAVENLYIVVDGALIFPRRLQDGLLRTEYNV